MKYPSFFRAILILGFLMLWNSLGYSQQESVVLRPLKTIQVLTDVTSGNKSPQNPQSPKNPVISCMDVDHTGTFLVVGGDDHHVAVQRITTGKTVILERQFDWIRGVAFNPAATKLAAVAQNGVLQIWDVLPPNDITAPPIFQETMTIDAQKHGHSRGLQKVAFRPDGSSVAVCGFDAMVSLFDVKTGKLLSQWKTPQEGNRVLEFSPDGKWLAVCGLGKTFRVWNLTAGEPYRDIDTDNRRIHAIAFSPDSSRLAVGGDSPNISLWRLSDGANVATLTERPGKTFALVFWGENQLASGESDNAVRIWQLSTGQCVATLLGHTGTIATLFHDTTVNQLLSGSFDTTVRFWKW